MQPFVKSSAKIIFSVLLFSRIDFGFLWLKAYSHKWSRLNFRLLLGYSRFLPEGIPSVFRGKETRNNRKRVGKNV